MHAAPPAVSGTHGIDPVHMRAIASAQGRSRVRAHLFMRDARAVAAIIAAQDAQDASERMRQQVADAYRAMEDERVRVEALNAIRAKRDQEAAQSDPDIAKAIKRQEANARSRETRARNKDQKLTDRLNELRQLRWRARRASQVRAQRTLTHGDQVAE